MNYNYFFYVWNFAQNIVLKDPQQHGSNFYGFQDFLAKYAVKKMYLFFNQYKSAPLISDFKKVCKKSYIIILGI